MNLPFKDLVVINKDGSNLGQMSFQKAKELADLEGLDLVKISEQQQHCVYKIMDESKWKYEQKKKEKNKSHKVPVLKEIKFHINTEDHDIQTKVAHIRRFLEKGHSVRVSVDLRGRFKNYLQLACEKLESIIQSVNIVVRRDAVKTLSSGSATSIGVTIHPVSKKNEQKDVLCRQGQ